MKRLLNNSRQRKLLKGKEGFTIVEVVVALAIAAIIFVGVFNSISNIRKVNNKANHRLVGHSEITTISNYMIDTPHANRTILINNYIKKTEATGGLGFKDHPQRNSTTQFKNTFIKDFARENIRIEIDMGQSTTRIEDVAVSKKSHRIIIRVKRRIIIEENGVRKENFDRGIDDVYVWKTYGN